MSETQRCIFGRVSILEKAREVDQILTCQLIDWKLANGLHPKIFALASVFTTTTTSSTTTSSTITSSTITTPSASIDVAVELDSPKLQSPPLSDEPQSDTIGCATPTVGGEKVTFYNDAYFSRIRKHYNIPANIVSDKESFDWNSMKPSLGKGGDAMQFTKDKKYLVKELGSDHPTLLEITKSYTEHVLSGDSLLVRFGLHFKRESDQKNYVLMNGWLPAPSNAAESKEDNFDSFDAFREIYDLKGCADDKMMLRNGLQVNQIHNRCWMVSTKCFPTPERHIYVLGKDHAKKITFKIDEIQRNLILSKIKKDTDWLKLTGLMDYSLIVGIKKCSDYQLYKNKNGFSAGDTYSTDMNQPFVVHDHTSQVAVRGYYIGIIDFLQFYNCGKTVAHHIKCCDVKPLATVPPEEYGTRFFNYFEKKFKTTKNTLKMVNLSKNDDKTLDENKVGMSKEE
jgi:hypothetical protein